MCGGGMVSATRDFKTHRRAVYVCAFHQERGTAVCQNRLAAPLEPCSARSKSGSAGFQLCAASCTR
jgi:hypothetical protein